MCKVIFVKMNNIIDNGWNKTAKSVNAEIVLKNISKSGVN